MANNPTLHVRILSPQQLILDTEATSISSKNSQGDFDILPQHANFITLVENSPIEVRLADKRHLSFAFPLAIILVKENKVDIYTHISYLKQEEAKAKQPAPAQPKSQK